jgi:hypothetical protein
MGRALESACTHIHVRTAGPPTMGLCLFHKLTKPGAQKRVGTDAPTLVRLPSYVTYAEAARILRSICPMSVSRPLLRFSYSRTLFSSSTERPSSRSEISATFISS